MLSPGGHAVLGTGVLLSGLGWGLGYPEAVDLGAACLLAVVLAAAWAYPRQSIRARREVVPAKVARGDPTEGVVVLSNTGTRTVRGLRAEDFVAGEPVYPVALPPVPPGGQVRARYPLPSHRRGRVPVGPMHLIRGDPLGLGRHARVHGDIETLLVRPRTVPLPVLPAGRTHHLEGPTSDTAQDGTLTFHSLREYVLGDDLRRVHWKSTARMGSMMVRRMVDVSLPVTTVVLDTDPSAYEDRGGPPVFEVAVDAAASVACAVARHHFPLRFLTGAGPLDDDRGRGPDAGRILDLLALVETDPGHTLAAALDALERLRPTDTLVVVTGTTATIGPNRLGRLGRRYDRVVVIRIAPAHHRHPAPSALPPGVVGMDVTGLDELGVAWRAEAQR
ncbi:DUF58 domain-containing protein [Embleya hyalina]|uniref:DUF58 domain-containing protein n=1 Tax=Embleya hyalina TaxID=516124 RepID=A0A401YQU9_9ACTN|nr:DUF58 domain-containing protein [Embleya hyalina]GCD96937.1 hypothetical protein EHYA_04624 [Embleya hyalina]